MKIQGCTGHEEPGLGCSGEIPSGYKKRILVMRTSQRWNRFLREVVESPLLEISKAV